MPSSIKLVGVLNVTPDSFSDGGVFLEEEAALKYALQLLSEGASFVDVGGDSTRPGSSCVGPEEELCRVRPVIERLEKEEVPFAVDTHHASTAQYSIEHGAVMINDVMAGHDPEMFSVVADSTVLYVMMYSRCSTPHRFSETSQGSICTNIERFFEQRIECALRAGIRESQIVLDPGMGAFISDDPEDSWRVIRDFLRFSSFGFPLYFGSSRKGFLKLPFETDIRERDYLTAVTGKIVSESLAGDCELFVRIHSVCIQKAILARTFHQTASREV